MQFLGIDIGSSSVKATLLNGHGEEWAEAIAHDGDIPGTLRRILDLHPTSAPIQVVTTGNAGRNQVCTARVIPPQAIEAGLRAIGERPDAVVSLGGESIVVYTFTADGLTQTAMMGDKCAAGTGEFFRQQLGRMNIDLSAIPGIPDDTTPHPLSARCSVFMKSDCTHKLNKKECTKEEIVVSLAEVMASKAAEFLTRARVTSGRVVLIGGVTRNRFIRNFLQAKLPGLQLLTPAQGPHFEAFGAAHLAQQHGTPLPPADQLIDEGAVTFDRYPPLSEGAAHVTWVPSVRGKLQAGRNYVLGIDGGSTTTKAVLLDAETKHIVAAYYGRTHGDPVEALRTVLVELRTQVRAALGTAPIRVSLAATTGSSREVLGVFAETGGVYNEIIAHSVGTTHFCPEIDTIFEIGGQDAKYVLLRNGVPIDYAMNEACSAGTGSFLEESARGDLNIQTAPEIGPIAMASTGPLKFGEHCSAFINTDIRSAIQQGAAKEDIVGGIVLSIVSNYLNRVVGNRSVGSHIVLQGGVAKNPAVPAAFATVLGKEILVPPDPELLGAFGVGLLAIQKHHDGLLAEGDFSLDALIDRQITYGKDFKCQACENLCRIRTLFVGPHRYFFGGRCNKYANLRQNRSVDLQQTVNYVTVREQILFHDFAPGLYLITGVTALILVLAANTAFNGFPVLGSILAQDRYLPRQLHTRGDRLAFSNGIVFLAMAAIAFIVAFDAEVTTLIQLYIVGVFVSFTLSQIGMVRHWTRLLRTENDPAERRRMIRSRVINTIGFVCTGTVLIIVLVTKFLAGAWIAILAMGSLFAVMKAINRHYATVTRELTPGEDDRQIVLPSRNHAVVLVSNMQLPTLRALAYARATRPDVLEALTVNVDDAETRKLTVSWEDSDVSVPLKVVASPYREVTGPVLDYVKRISKEAPRTVVTVFIPEYVVGHWWESLLHNQSALRLKTRLLFMPNVMMTSVPWQLNSSERVTQLEEQSAPGDVRRGFSE